MGETWTPEQAVRLIVAALRYPDSDVARAAAKVATEVNVPLVELLRRARTRERSNRWIVGLLVKELAHLSRYDLLRELLDYEDRRFAEAAAEVLRAEAGVAIVPATTPDLGGKRPEDGSRQIEPLGDDVLSIARLILGMSPGVGGANSAFRLLGAANPALREAALDMLAEFAQSSQEGFFEALGRADVPITGDLLSLLKPIRDSRIIGYIARHLNSCDNQAKVDAVLEILSGFAEGRSAELVVQIWARAEGEHDLSGLRKAFKRIGPPAVGPILRAYAEDARIRRIGGALLGEVAGPAALDNLLGALRNQYRIVREEAERGLAIVGEPAIAPLTALLGADDPEVRRRAARALGAIGDPRALGPLARMARGRDLGDCRTAVAALGGLKGERVLDVLSEVVHSGDRRTRELAVASIGRHDDARASALLLEALRDPDPQVRLSAIRLFRGRIPERRLGRDRAVEALTRTLLDPDPAVADAASEALVTIGNFALPWLKNCSINIKYFKIHEKIKIIIKKIAHKEAKERAALEYGPWDSCNPFFRVGRHEVSDVIPEPIRDNVYFSVIAPRILAPGGSRVIDVLVHLEEPDRLFSRLAGLAYYRHIARPRSAGPTGVERGLVMVVRLEVADFGIDGLEDTVYWAGTSGQTTFPVAVPDDAAPGPHVGLVHVSVAGLQVARIYFELVVGAGGASERELGAEDVTTRDELLRTAFASYAHEDLNEVLARVQGMLKVLPDLEVFLDVLTLRSGEDWEARIEQEIAARDAFFLLWSLPASHSRWVDKEWRTALAKKGLEAIDPVPLQPPTIAPPPPELARLHFNDWALAFRRPEAR
jgi:HEAT repeat protein